MTPLDRLRARTVITETGCWQWTGALRRGYGAIWVEGRTEQVHVLAYRLLVGEVPAQQQIDHTCHNSSPCAGGPSCPQRAEREVEHLEPTSSRSNTLRSPVAQAAVNARKTHCAKGHAFDEANTHINPEGKRRCRRCDRERMAAKSEGLQASALDLLDRLIAVGVREPVA